jgi:hypothetical protein
MFTKELELIMKKLDDNEIRAIAHNCKKATYLVEKRQLTMITAREKLELKIHLAGCSLCRIFALQSLLINRLVKNYFQAAKETDLSLDENFKRALQEKIENKLKEQ